MFTASRVEAQIIVNGSSIGTTASNVSVTPVSGTGTLLVNANSSITAPGPFGAAVGVSSGAFYAITNNGVMTNNGQSDTSQVLDMALGGLTFNVVNNGTMSINPASVYEVVRFAQGPDGTANSGTFSNYGLVEALGAGVGLAGSKGQFVVNNSGTMRAGIGFWGGSTSLPGGTSLTVNQLAGESGSNLANEFSVFSFAKSSTVNVSGGTLTRSLLFGGNGNSSVVNLSGGQINGALDYRDATNNTVNITGGSLNGNVLYGTSTGTVYFNRGTSSTYSYAVSGAGSVVNSSGVTTLTQTNSYTGPTRIDAGGLVVNGAITNSAITVGAGAFLGGSGRISGTVGGAGTVAPGNSPGILTAGAVDPTGGLDFTFEFSGTVPNYASASASVNDVLRLTGSTPFTSALTSANTKMLFLNFTKAALTVGTGTITSLTGGFFTDQATDFTSSLYNAIWDNGGFTAYVLGDGLGTDNFLNGQGYYNWRNPSMFGWNQSLFLSTVPQTADFGSGNVNGQVMLLTVAVPEPATYCIALAGLACGGYSMWRRRKRA